MLETADKLNNQAIMLAAGGSFREAIACFVRAITIEKDNYLLWYNLGITYRDAGKLSEAREALSRAYSISSDDDDVIESLALVCCAMGDFQAAFDCCGEGLDANPRNLRLWNTAGVIYFNRGEYQAAAEAFERAVSLNPWYGDALYNLRDTYERLGNADGQRECAARLQAMGNSD